MASVKIDAPELLAILATLPPEQNLMLIGRHGIGKSQVITAFHEKQGRKVIPLFLGQMADPGDLIGLLQVDEKTKRSHFLPPHWWPEENEAIVLFLDELNRARPEILQAVMDLTLNRTLAGKSLPEGSYVVAAINEGDEYQLTDLDPALVSRFNVYEFAPSVDDWLIWATEKKLDPRVLQFIQENHNWLDTDGLSYEHSTTMERDLEKSPDRRSWEKVANLIKPIKTLENIHVKLLSGVIGAPAALEFMRHQKKQSSLSADEVLLRFSKAKTQLNKMETPELANLNTQLLLWINGESMTEKQKKSVSKNFLQYIELMSQLNHREVLAHLASKLVDPRFDKASMFVFADPKIIEKMTEYVQGISID